MLGSSLTIGVMLLSVHSHPGFETITPGLYVTQNIVDNVSVTAGGFRNSMGNMSGFAGVLLEHPLSKTNMLGLLVGGVVGYDKPMLLVSPSFAHTFYGETTIRLSYIPAPPFVSGSSDAVSLSFEWKFK